MVDKHLGKCLACQATTSCHTRKPLQMTILPKGPWQKVSVDFAGPFPNKDMALVFWDQYSRYPVAEFVTSTSAEAVISSLHMFSMRMEFQKRSSLIMGLRLMVQSLRSKPSQKDSRT